MSRKIGNEIVVNNHFAEKVFNLKRKELGNSLFTARLRVVDKSVIVHLTRVRFKSNTVTIVKDVEVNKGTIADYLTKTLGVNDEGMENLIGADGKIEEFIHLNATKRKGFDLDTLT